MNQVRIIPRLDIKGSNLVKGIHQEGLRVLGKPETFARYYYETGADELLYIDVVASLFGRNSLHDIISKTAKEIFIPLTVGGGLRSIEDIRAVLRAGADKVVLNTAALQKPVLIKEASRIFGSSTILVGIEAVKQPDGKYLAFTDNGRGFTGVEVLDWACRAAESGAGEILITSVDREGTGKGFDLDLIRQVATAVSIPIIAHGGAGKPADVAAAVAEGRADAVALASILHYGSLLNLVQDKDRNLEGNTDFLDKKLSVKYLETITIPELKSYLTLQKIACRV